MQLIINKIGKIKDANLKINGLTVIAGKNDTGKSTVGKVLYAIFRALEMYKWYIDERQMLRIESRYFRPLLKKYTERDVVSELGQRCAKLLLELRETEEVEKVKRELLSLHKIEEITKQIGEQDGLTNEINGLIDSIESELKQLRAMPLSDKFSKTLTTTMRTMFLRFINNSKYKENAGVTISNGSTKLLEAFVENDQVTASNLNEKHTFPFGDTLYIETPFVLEEQILAFYKPNWMELRGKIENIKKDPTRDEEMNVELVRFIQREILRDSVIAFDEKEKEFFYQVDSESSKLPITNAACGIRSFALLFVLLKYNILTRDMLLVLDEPENHLHPEFQIKYAEMISLLVKEGFTIVLTSHSPTFIQALSGFVRSYNIKEKTSFYLATQIKKENYSTFEDVSENISKIFESLVFPLEQLFRNV